MAQYRFVPPPGWPRPPEGWRPPKDWTPDPNWPAAPAGWNFWVLEEESAVDTVSDDATAIAVEPSADVVPSNVVAEKTSEPEATTPTIESASETSDHPSPPGVDEEIDAKRGELADLEEVIAERRHELDRVQAELDQVSESDLRGRLVELNDALVLQEVGIYEYHHPLENAEQYRDALAELQERLKDSVREGKAVLASDMFSYNNSLAKGRKMTSDFSKLMLRAYNSEADSSVRSLRAGNVTTAKKRLEASASTIARLGSMMEMRIAPEYHELRCQEVELTADYLMKVQEEREAAREERERLREERKAEQELKSERERLDKERAHYANALEALEGQGSDSEYGDLTQRLAEIDAAIAQNDFRAANIRAGYVYVISNVGAFGEHVVKIGMTRRLDPLDRVRELGGASVPFPFDVHAIYFSRDAVTLESELHKHFAERRLNQVNQRREFFFATPHEVRELLAAKVGNLLEFVEDPEATQYFQSHALWPDSLSTQMGPA
jgi:multidrug efflux pump subunit AcrA (membrane-fusion protein)